MRWWAAILTCAAIAQATRSVWDGVYAEEQARRGVALYARECAGCHGTELTGGEEAPALAGGAFTSNWNGLTVGDLFERTRTTMPQNNPGRLTRQQQVDILAYVLSANGFPAGKAEMEPRTEALRQVRFEAERSNR